MRYSIWSISFFLVLSQRVPQPQLSDVLGDLFSSLHHELLRGHGNWTQTLDWFGEHCAAIPSVNESNPVTLLANNSTPCTLLAKESNASTLLANDSNTSTLLANDSNASTLLANVSCQAMLVAVFLPFIDPDGFSVVSRKITYGGGIVPGVFVIGEDAGFDTVKFRFSKDWHNESHYVALVGSELNGTDLGDGWVEFLLEEQPALQLQFRWRVCPENRPHVAFPECGLGSEEEAYKRSVFGIDRKDRVDTFLSNCSFPNVEAHDYHIAIKSEERKVFVGLGQRHYDGYLELVPFQQLRRWTFAENGSMLSTRPWRSQAYFSELCCSTDDELVSST